MNAECHHYPTLVFRAGDLQVYGASKIYVNENSAASFDLIINLSARRKFGAPTSLISGPREWGFLRKFTDKAPLVEELVFMWEDPLGVFPVGRAFWVAFYGALQKHKKVLFFCDSGHGRTATAIACLMTVAKKIHGAQAIREIKENYCLNAITSSIQENYVRSMTEPRQL